MGTRTPWQMAAGAVIVLSLTLAWPDRALGALGVGYAAWTDTITIEGFVTEDTIRAIYEVLQDAGRQEKMVEKNYALGKRYFSYEVLERSLIHLIHTLEIQCGGR